MAGLPGHKSFGNGQFNPITDRTTCHVSRFQAYEHGSVTSPDTLVSKGHHCNWDYILSALSVSVGVLPAQSHHSFL